MKLSGAGRAGALVVALAGVAGVMGCATTSTSSGSPAAAAERAVAASAGAASAADTAERSGPPIIQVRDFPASAVVTVVAWSPDDPRFGLRASVRRDGEVVGLERHGHVVYVSAAHVDVMGGFNRAWMLPVPPGPVLEHWRTSDRHACNGGDACAPMSTVQVHMPDSLLRQHRDSLVVNFTAGRIRNWSVAVDREVVDTYLRTVDSVTAALRVR